MNSTMIKLLIQRENVSMHAILSKKFNNQNTILIIVGNFLLFLMDEDACNVLC